MKTGLIQKKLPGVETWLCSNRSISTRSTGDTGSGCSATDSEMLPWQVSTPALLLISGAVTAEVGQSFDDE